MTDYILSDGPAGIDGRSCVGHTSLKCSVGWLRQWCRLQEMKDIDSHNLPVRSTSLSTRLHLDGLQEYSPNLPSLD
jgi:hypothetical protein